MGKETIIESDLLGIVQQTLGTLDCRQSFSPGIFEPLLPLFKNMGYVNAAVYIVDDFPDRMHMAAGYGDGKCFPGYIIASTCRNGLYAELEQALAGVPGLMTARLFSHGRELGAIAVTTARSANRRSREAFEVLAKSVSVMAYVERIRTNSSRERQEREVFFAQSLTNRLLIRKAPKVKGLHLGFEFIRCLEAGGDFFDLAPSRNGLMGFIGCCNGKGLRTVMEVTCIMREIFRSLQSADSLAASMLRVNDFLVREKARAHQASLCLFEVDTQRHTLRLAKAGRLGLLLGGPGSELTNISAPGALFLGMDPKPKIRDEIYDFAPGQALLCVTEGLYTSRNCLNAKPQLHWFLRAVEATLASKRKLPLANAVFANLDNAGDLGTRPTDSMLALSVEFTGKGL